MDYTNRCTRIHHGKHEEKLAEVVFLRHPDYIAWLRHRDRNGPYMHFHVAVNCIRQRFDDIPLNRACRCGAQATRFGLYSNSTVPSFWCDHHQPTPAVDHMEYYCGLFSDYHEVVHYDVNGKRLPQPWIAQVIRHIARAKGYPQHNFTEKRVAEFFYAP